MQKNETVTFRPKEVFHTLESWKRFWMTILLIMILAVACKDVDASNPEEMYNSDQEITLTVENAAALYETMEAAGGDVETVRSQELVESSIIVNIPGGTNVRSLTEGSVGRIVQGFNQYGENPLVAYIDPTGSGSMLEALGNGALWGVINYNGELVAVSLGVVNQNDGTPVTEGELTGAGVTQLVYDAGTRSFVVGGGEDEDSIGSGDGDGDEPEPTATSTATPEVLTMPEVPSELTFQVPYYDTTNRRVAYRNPETITVNQDQLLPLPLGFVDGDEAAWDFLRAHDDTIVINGEPFHYGENVTRQLVTGIVVSVDNEPSVPNGWKITLRTQTPNGNWYTIQVDVQNYINSVPVDGELNPTITTASDNINLREACREDVIQTRNATIRIGDMVGLGFLNADHWDHEDSNSLLPRMIEVQYGITGGLPAFIRAVDNGTIDSDTASINVRISFDQMLLVHAD